MKLKKIYGIAIGMLALTFSLTACGGSESSATNTNLERENGAQTQEVETAEEEAIVIDHAFGQTVLETKPERVATISWANQDVPLALGVIPVGISEANYGVLDDSGLLPWTKEKFEELGEENPVLFRDATGLDYEAISDANPDVILAAYSGITQEEYDLLSEIAPVVAYPQAPWQTFWRDQILMDAKGMGMEEEGKALVSGLENLIAEKTSQYPQIKGKKAAFFFFDEANLGKFWVYLPSDPRAAYLTDLGMVIPESVQKLTEQSDYFTLELSSENIDLITDVEIIVCYGNETLLDALQKDPLIGTLEAVQKGSVVIVETGTPLAASGTPSALSIPATIDEYLSLIAQAADKVE